MFKTVKRIIDWCGEFKGKLYLGFVMTFFSHIFAAMPLALAAYTVGLLIESQQAGTPFDTSWIWKCIVIQVALVLLRFLFDYFRARLQEPISYQLTARDRLAIGDALKRVSLGYFQQVSTGNILSSITTGLSTLENMGIRMIDNFVGGYLNFLVIFVCLAVCSPVTALIALAAALLSLLCMLLISHYSRINSPVEAQANRDMTGAVIEYARGLAVVKSFGKSGAAMESVTKAISDSKKIHLKIEWGYVPGNALHLLALKCGSVGLALAAALQCLRGEMDFSLMLMFVFFSFSIFASLEPISDSAHTLGVIDDAMDQLDALRGESLIDADGKDIPLEHYDITFDHVDFGYDSRQVLKDVSFTIPEKTSTAIVGPSGGGKSTVAKLIARFWDVTSGAITIGGVNVKDMPLSQLSEYVSFVTQDNFLFRCSLLENIRLGNPNATDEEVKAAARAAQCEEFISKLPQGYDTPAGEAGKRLSGGEKQRIAIARMMLKNAPIVILDEATAFTDPENEDKIQRSIAALTRGKTLLVIAHRLSTIKSADNIVVLKNGAIAAQGTQEQLLETCPLYQDMWRSHIGAKNWAVSTAAKEA